MKSLGLYKKEKLCSAVAIDALFGRGGAEFSRLSYPLRVVARRNDGRRSDAEIQFLISIPKKRLRHAVDRVLMRRRVREAYRLIHRDYRLGHGQKIDLAFIYVADKLVPYRDVEQSVKKILSSLHHHFTKTNDETDK